MSRTFRRNYWLFTGPIFCLESWAEKNKIEMDNKSIPDKWIFGKYHKDTRSKKSVLKKYYEGIQRRESKKIINDFLEE